MIFKIYPVILLLGLLTPTGGSLKVNVLKDNAPGVLEIISDPYLTSFALGEPLNLEGLKIRKEGSEEEIILDDLSVTGYDETNLGVQTLVLGYDGSYAELDLRVTNEWVYNTLPVTQELFISEVMWLDDDHIGIELFNNTAQEMDLSSYTINLFADEEEVIPLQDITIESEEALVVSNIINGSYYSKDIDFNGVSSIVLSNNETSIDEVLLICPEDEGDSWVLGHSIRRHYKVLNPSITFNSNEWILTDEGDKNIGVHIMSSLTVSIEEQAKAYARYVMFGAGMFAAGRVEEAYLELKNEYLLMTNAAQDYFINNKDVKVEGMNENGNHVSVTFRNAHERIGLLASRSGKVSFLPKANTNLRFDTQAVFLVLLALFVLASAGVYTIMQSKRL